jgi:hypothetical protein
MSRWTEIILHHSATKDTPDVDTEKFRRYHMNVNGWNDIGYHGVIEDVMGVYQFLGGRPGYMDGAHCRGRNKFALGLCFTGNFDLYQMPEEQIVVGARQIATWCVMNDIEPNKIGLHRMWGQTDCPGSKFPEHIIISEVEKRLET